MFGIANRLFGQDAKLEFRKPGHGVHLLYAHTIAAEDPYWAQYWLLFDSQTDVITLLDNQTLSTALARNATNLCTLVQVLTAHIFALLSQPDFPHAPPSASASTTQWLGNQEHPDLAKEALNCVRVLARVVPFLYLSYKDQSSSIEHTLFWKKQRVAVERAPEDEPIEEGQFVIDDEEQEGGPAQQQWEDLPPLSERLLAALVDLLFVPGFTVADDCRVPDSCIAHVIWEPGIASQPEAVPPTPHHYLAARLEILRLLNSLLSLPSLTTPPHVFPTVPNRWRETLISSDLLDRQVVLCLLCSLVNTAFATGRPAASSSTSPQSSIFNVASGAVGKLTEVALRREDAKGMLVGACLQSLSILLSQHGHLGPDPPTNNFAFYISKLHRQSDLDFLANGCLDLLAQPLSQSFVPAAITGQQNNPQQKTGWAQETLVAFWRICEVNPKLSSHMAQSEQASELIAILLSYCLEFKDDEVRLGLVRLAAFMLQTVTTWTGQQDRLNEPPVMRPGLRSKFGTSGTLGDFIIVSIHTLIFSTRARLSSLYPAFVLSITNISPHLKNLSVASSTKLVQLFLAFSAPSFLLMEEGNPRLVYYLLESFDNVIHHQLSDNPNLSYAIIRAHKRFEELSTFTLSAAIAEARRQKAERKSGQMRSREASTGTSEKDAETATTDEAIASEKARGKMRASSSGSIPLAGSSISEAATTSESTNATETEEQPFVGKHGFVPTEAWVSSWREGLPLDSIMILLAELRPKIFDISSEDGARREDEPVRAIEFLKSASLAGLLPSIPADEADPSAPSGAAAYRRKRNFLETPQSVAWLASLVYGSVYVSSLELLREVPVQLFTVATLPRKASAAVDLVSGAAQFVLSKVKQ